MKLTVCVAFAVAGTLAHNALEFGWAGLYAAENFSIPWVLIWTSLTIAWWRIEDARRPIARAMFAVALLSLIGGAIGSVLPLGVNPVDPEQTLGHYLAHLLYGFTQLPLLFVLWPQIGPGHRPDP